jgi:hypothetical protein
MYKNLIVFSFSSNLIKIFNSILNASLESKIILTNKSLIYYKLLIEEIKLGRKINQDIYIYILKKFFRLHSFFFPK